MDGWVGGWMDGWMDFVIFRMLIPKQGLKGELKVQGNFYSLESVCWMEQLAGH